MLAYLAQGPGFGSRRGRKSLSVLRKLISLTLVSSVCYASSVHAHAYLDVKQGYCGVRKSTIQLDFVTLTRAYITLHTPYVLVALLFCSCQAPERRLTALIGRYKMSFTLHYITLHLRLCEITGKQLFFGGISVIIFGDLLQLPPVKGSAPYMALKGEEIRANLESIDACHLWETFVYDELTIN